MTLADMLQAHDAAALEALANKGLVRRAMREVDTYAFEILSRTPTTAKVKLADVTVTLHASGPQPQHCPCSATSLCRHLITAILAVRTVPAEDVPPNDASPDSTAPPSPSDIIAALNLEGIEKLAGTDLGAAARIATGAVQITQQGQTLAVHLPDWADPVQFLTGQPPRAAVFKGPASRKRLAIAAAVLAVRAQSGTAFDLPDTTLSEPGLSADYLDAVSTALEQLVTGTLRGAAQVAMDHLFDLAISARVQAAPRVSGAVRSLLTTSARAMERHVSFAPDEFVASAAQTYALLEALRVTPSDTALLGVLRRDYAPAPPMEALILGAVGWHAPSGARGLRVFAYDPKTARWLSAGPARAAGSDLAFTPATAYRQALFGASSAKDLICRRASFPAPLLNTDGQLSPSVTATRGPELTQADLAHPGFLHTDWPNAMADLQARTPRTGLRISPIPQPILLSPTKITAQGFDDFTQVYRLTLTDKSANTLPLILPGSDTRVAQMLENPPAPLAGVLCVPSFDHGGRSLSLISVLTTKPNGHLHGLNPSLDTVPLPKKRGVFGRLLHGAPTAERTTLTARDPLGDLAQAALQHVTDSLSHPAPAAPDLAHKLDGAGLMTLADAMRAFDAAPTPRLGLQTAYIAGRVMRRS